MSRRAYRILPTESTTFYPRLHRNARRGRGQLLSFGQRRRRRAQGGRQRDRRRGRGDVRRRPGQPADAHHRRRVPDPGAPGGRAARDRGERQHGGADARRRRRPTARAVWPTCPTRASSPRACRPPSARCSPCSRAGARCRFTDVIAPALELAKNGFPVSEGLRNQHKYGIAPMRERFLREWPGSAGALPARRQRARGGRAAAERGACADLRLPRRTRRTRSTAFYHGDVAAEIVKFSKAHDGLLEREDFAALRDAHRRARVAEVRRHRALQVRLLDAGTGRAADPRADVAVRPEENRLRHARLLPPADRGDEARLRRPRAVLRRSDARCRARSCFRSRMLESRAKLIDMKSANRELRPGDAWRNAALLPEDEKLHAQGLGRGHGARRRGGRQGQHGLVHAERRVDLVRRGDPGARLPALGAHDDLLPRAGAPSERGRAGQAPAHHAHAFDGVQERQALDDLRHHGRRQPGAVAAAVLPVPRGLRHDASRRRSRRRASRASTRRASSRRTRASPTACASSRASARRCSTSCAAAATTSTSRPTGAKASSRRAQFDEDTGLIEAGCDPRGAKSECFPAFALAW